MDLFDGNPRERNLLIGMGVVLIGFLIWVALRFLGGGEPVSDDRDAALRDLQLVQTALASQPSAAASTAPKAPFDRAALIRNAREAGLTISRVEPGADGALSVTFDAAAPQSVMRFLTQLETTTNVVIASLDMGVEGTDDGAVEARMTLRPSL